MRDVFRAGPSARRGSGDPEPTSEDELTASLPLQNILRGTIDRIRDVTRATKFGTCTTTGRNRTTTLYVLDTLESSTDRLNHTTFSEEFEQHGLGEITCAGWIWKDETYVFVINHTGHYHNDPNYRSNFEALFTEPWTVITSPMRLPTLLRVNEYTPTVRQCPLGSYTPEFTTTPDNFPPLRTNDYNKGNTPPPPAIGADLPLTDETTRPRPETAADALPVKRPRFVIHTKPSQRPSGAPDA